MLLKIISIANFLNEQSKNSVLFQKKNRTRFHKKNVQQQNIQRLTETLNLPVILNHQVNSDGAPIKSSLQARWTRLRIQMDWIPMLVSNIMSCSVTQQKSPTILQLWPNKRKLCRWLKIQWKGNGVMFVASRWYAPWFPQGLPNKQETVGFVCRLSAPVVVGHPKPGHMCVPLKCGWGVGATHHPEKGVCAHIRMHEHALAKYKEGTCADNVEHLVFVLASLGCSRSRSRSRC